LRSQNYHRAKGRTAQKRPKVAPITGTTVEA
jgi:hypothetical protein